MKLKVNYFLIALVLSFMASATESGQSKNFYSSELGFDCVKPFCSSLLKLKRKHGLKTSRVPASKNSRVKICPMAQDKSLKCYRNFEKRLSPAQRKIYLEARKKIGDISQEKLLKLINYFDLLKYTKNDSALETSGRKISSISEEQKASAGLGHHFMSAARFLSDMTLQWGVGISGSAFAGLGYLYGLELVHFNEGQIAMYCAPGYEIISDVGFGYGYSLIKPLGCKKPGDYTGNFVTIAANLLRIY